MDALTLGRSAAESLMVDYGRAERPTGRDYDPTQQAEVDTYEPLFSSRCKIGGGQLGVLTEEAGGRTVTTARLRVDLPVETEPLEVGDVWVMTEVSPESTSVVGRRYRVTKPVDGTFRTARRYDVEVVT